MPFGEMLPGHAPVGAGVPTFCCQINCARRGVERIDIIRFRTRDDHRTIGTALDVKRLGVHVAGNRAVKAQITRQVRGRRERKRRVDVTAVAGSVVVLLRDVNLNLAFGAAQPDDTEEGDQRSQSY